MSTPKERPILFSAPMVRAILAGKKTQTRRIITPQPQHAQHHSHKGKVIYDGEYCMWCWENLVLDNLWDFPGNNDRATLATRCRHGIVGDRLWVRETWAAPVAHNHLKPRELQSWMGCWWKADDNRPLSADELRWRPSIFMPRWASRITLEITGVRVEKLQEITEDDAKAEGCAPWPFNDEQTITTGERGAESPYRGGYAVLWDDLNDERATWKSNPFVWVLEFKRLCTYSR